MFQSQNEHVTLTRDCDAVVIPAGDQVRLLSGMTGFMTQALGGSFTVFIDGIHAHDLGTIVDREGVAIRTGHHCAMPVMERFGVAATARASFALYNDRSDVDRLMAGLKRAVELFRG